MHTITNYTYDVIYIIHSGIPIMCVIIFNKLIFFLVWELRATINTLFLTSVIWQHAKKMTSLHSISSIIELLIITSYEFISVVSHDYNVLRCPANVLSATIVVSLSFCLVRTELNVFYFSFLVFLIIRRALCRAGKMYLILLFQLLSAFSFVYVSVAWCILFSNFGFMFHSDSRV